MKKEDNNKNKFHWVILFILVVIFIIWYLGENKVYDSAITDKSAELSDQEIIIENFNPTAENENDYKNGWEDINYQISSYSKLLFPNSNAREVNVGKINLSFLNSNDEHLRCIGGGGLAGCVMGDLQVTLNGKKEVINSMDKLKTLVIPINSKEKAIGFLFADSSSVSPILLEYKGLKTKIKQDGDNFLIKFYSYSIFGCGNHGINEIVAKITSQGEMTFGEQRQITKSSMDGACVD